MAKARKGFKAIAQCRRALGRTWRVRPYIMLWLYTAVVRPSLDYGAVAWVAASCNQRLMNKLGRVQRTALLSVCNMMTSTPTAAIECRLDLLPIDIRLQEVAVRTMHRIQTNGGWTISDDMGNLTALRSHVRICHRLSKEIPTLRLPVERMEALPPQMNFQTVVKSRRELENCLEPKPTAGTECCFTDGSKVADGSTGSGFYVENEHGIVKEGILPLGTWPTVFQCEMYALLSPAKVLKLLGTGTNSMEIHIYSDSLSTILAITKSHYQTETVAECRRSLEELGTETRMSLI